MIDVSTTVTDTCDGLWCAGALGSDRRLLSGRHKREAQLFTVEASVPAPCDDASRADLTQQLQQRAAAYTENVTCFNDGSCRLAAAEVAPCVATSRRKRRAQPLPAVRVKVSVIYDDVSRRGEELEQTLVSYVRVYGDVE